MNDHRRIKQAQRIPGGTPLTSVEAEDKLLSLVTVKIGDASRIQGEATWKIQLVTVVTNRIWIPGAVSIQACDQAMMAVWNTPTVIAPAGRSRIPQVQPPDESMPT